MVRMERKFGNTDDGRGRFLRQIGALEFKNKERTNFRKKGRCCQMYPKCAQFLDLCVNVLEAG